MGRIDHIVIAVDDLEKGARLVREKTGLSSVPGGRHPVPSSSCLSCIMAPEFQALPVQKMSQTCCIKCSGLALKVCNGRGPEF